MYCFQESKALVLGCPGPEQDNRKALQLAGRWPIGLDHRMHDSRPITTDQKLM